MRSTIIKTCDMIKARANASGDVMLEGLAYTLVVMNQVSYDELDPEVWDKRAFDCATIGPFAGPY